MYACMQVCLYLSLSYSFSAVNMNNVHLETWWSWGNILHSQSNSSEFNLVSKLCVKCFCSPTPKTDFSNVKNRINTATKTECYKKNFEAVIQLRFLFLVKNITAVTHKHRVRDRERDKESNFTIKTWKSQYMLLPLECFQYQVLYAEVFGVYTFITWHPNKILQQTFSPSNE